MRAMSLDRYLTDAELAAFMTAVRERRHVHQPRDYAFFALLANTGIRPSEALQLCRRDVCARGDRPWIRIARMWRGRGPHPTTDLPLHPFVATVVAAYVGQLEGPETLLFPWTKRQPARLFHYYARKAGIDPPRKVYALRHTAGMRLWRHAKDLRAIQAMLGHSRIKASAAYVHTDPATIAEAQQRCEIV